MSSPRLCCALVGWPCRDVRAWYLICNSVDHLGKTWTLSRGIFRCGIKMPLCDGPGALTSSTLASLDLGGNDLGAISLLPICAAYKAASAGCQLEALELFGNNHDEDGESPR
jgi:hypothetical protein|eukprot:COSAG02_NODE_4803_length_4959_cov_3.932716_4_plen_112_part_00